MDLFSAYLIGTAVDELRQETKKDIQALIEDGEKSTRLLVAVLPFLRTTETRRIRANILAHLDSSKIAAIVRREPT